MGKDSKLTKRGLKQRRQNKRVTVGAPFKRPREPEHDGDLGLAAAGTHKGVAAASSARLNSATKRTPRQTFCPPPKKGAPKEASTTNNAVLRARAVCFFATGAFCAPGGPRTARRRIRSGAATTKRRSSTAS